MSKRWQIRERPEAAYFPFVIYDNETGRICSVQPNHKSAARALADLRDSARDSLPGLKPGSQRRETCIPKDG